VPQQALILARLLRAQRGLATLVALLGLSGVAGRVLGVPILTQLSPAWPPMSLPSAMAFGLLGLTLAGTTSRRPGVRRSAEVAAGLLVLAMAGTLLSAMMAPEVMRWMALPVALAVGLLLVSSAVLLPRGQVGGILVSEVFGLLTMVLGLLALVDLALPPPLLQEALQIPLPISIAVLSAGLAVFLRRPDRGASRILAMDSATGRAARLLFLGLVPGVVLMVILVLIGEELGLYRRGMSATILPWTLILVFGIAAWRSLRDIARHERGLRRALRDVDMARDYLEVRVEERTAALQRLIGELNLARAEQAHRATHDALTGLPNRALFHDRLGHALARAARFGHQVGVLFIDLDGFKQVNDTLGHAAGDAMLREVARRLQSRVRASDTLARLGGDEFVVLLEHFSAPAQAEQAARSVLGPLPGPMEVEGHTVEIRYSMGMALSPEDGTTAEAILHAADQRMYSAKRQTGSR
jgi:diguanylate cyclase (GGDEF)-like protein